MKLDGVDLKQACVILDSNMFMTDYMRNYLKNNLVAAILDYRTNSGEEYFVHIPRTVFDELDHLKTKEGSENLNVRTEAVKGYEAAMDYVKKGLAVRIASDLTGVANGFNDVAMLTLLMELRRHTDVAILSNDRAFARDMMILNDLHSVKSSKKIRVFYINIKQLKMQEWIYDRDIDNAVRYVNEIKQ